MRGFLYVFGACKKIQSQQESRQLWALFCQGVYCICVLMCPVCERGGGRTGERGGENAELSVIEWAHHSAQREALYSAPPAYPAIEVTKQLCTA